MQIPGLNIGIVADDMTGACDTALQFFATHARTNVLLDLQSASQTPPCQDDTRENQVWSVNASSRHAGPSQAQALTRQAVALCRDRFGIENFYKKMDSTLRGHIAQECLGMLDEMKAQCAVIVPAYPQEGRRTVGGYQLVRGIPVEKTLTARDPLFPVRQSHIPTLLAQQSQPELVGYISLSVVLHGAGPILMRLNELIKEGKKLIAVDATSNEDLEQIALAIEKGQKNAKILPCGSAGLAQALGDLWAIEPDEGTIPPKPGASVEAPPSPILMVSGSNADITRQQIVQLSENYTYYGQGSELDIVELSPSQMLGLSTLDDTLERILNALGERNTVVLTTSLKPESYSRTIELAREQGIPEEEASRMAQDMLAKLAEAVVRTRPLKLVLIGGETTCQVCKKLDSRELEIVAEAEPSIPLTIDNHGRWIITKSGGFGSPLALANVVKFIRQRETASIHA